MAANISKMFTLGTVVTSAGQINQIVGHSMNPGWETLLFNSDGQVDPRFNTVLSGSPVLSFTTAAIARALTAAGIDCLAVAGTAVDLYFQKYVQGGTRQTGANSVKVSGAYGLLCPRSLQAGHNAFATLAYEMAARTNDGATIPLVMAAGQTMPTITAPDQLFGAGPVKINGTALEGVQSISIDFGHRLVIVGGSSCPYPEFIAVDERRPVITVRSTHVDFPTESGMGLYVTQGATDSLTYLRKFSQGGIRVADGTAEHISFAIDDGLVTIREAAANQGDGSGGMIEVVLEPSFDGTNAILAANLATAIS